MSNNQHKQATQDNVPQNTLLGNILEAVGPVIGVPAPLVKMAEDAVNKATTTDLSPVINQADKNHKEILQELASIKKMQEEQAKTDCTCNVGCCSCGFKFRCIIM